MTDPSPYQRESPLDVVGIRPAEKRLSGGKVNMRLLFDLALVAMLLVFLVVQMPRIGKGPPSKRSVCLNNLRQIGIAIRSYELATGKLPRATLVGDDGMPLHSWRTIILPFFDEGSLYDSIDLSKPWDHPVNVEARLQPTPDFLRCPSANLPHGMTTYLAIIAPDSCLQPGKGRTMSEITDEHANTILIIEVPPDMAVPWMSPWDTDEAVLKALCRAGNHLPHKSGLTALFLDGSTRIISHTFSEPEIRAWTSVSGNDGTEAF